MENVSSLWKQKLFILSIIILPFFDMEADAQMMKHGDMHRGSNTARRANNGPDSIQYFNPQEKEGFTHKLLVPGDSGLMGVLDVTSPLETQINEQEVELIPGKATSLLVYQVRHKNKVFLNPVLRIRKQADFSLRLRNSLREPTNIHWHGILTTSRNDGVPQHIAGSMENFQYDFKIINRASTYWYHPHPHGLTAKQVYAGLAGFLLVEDEQSDALSETLGLKFGETDIPLLIQDKRFDNSGQLIYNPSPMELFMGYYGDTILVNLTPKPVLPVKTKLYRFRILNGSTARLYRLGFVKGTTIFPFSIIANDGGLLPASHPASEVYLSPGERVEILLDLREELSGSEIYLKSLAFDPMENEMGGMGMGHMRDEMTNIELANGAEFYILKLAVQDKAAATGIIPEKLTNTPLPDENNVKVRPIHITQRHMRWFMNGLRYDMNAFPIEVRKGTKEIWELSNAELSMPHPIHIHGIQFFVLERKGSPEQVKNTAIDGKGRLTTDFGYKDTVLVWPGETVRLLADFSHDFPGNQDYVFHCHILEHEDGGMMLNYRIVEK